MSEEDQIVVDRLKRAIAALNIALEEAVDAGMNVEVEFERMLIESEPPYRTQTRCSATVTKHAFTELIPGA